MRKVRSSDLVGKTVKSVIHDSCNFVELRFTDGSNLELWAEIAVSVGAGSIPGIFVNGDEEYLENTFKPMSATTPKTSRSERLTERTCQLIKQGKHILLKRKDDWYLNAWTNIAAGPDNAVWGRRNGALEFFDLSIAFAVSDYFRCKVISVKR